MCYRGITIIGEVAAARASRHRLRHITACRSISSEHGITHREPDCRRENVASDE